MALDRFVHQEPFLTNGDEFSLTDFSHCHINPYGALRFYIALDSPRIERGPVRVCFKPRDMSVEEHHFTACGHHAQIGRNPSWARRLIRMAPIVFDFPVLRRGSQLSGMI